MKRKIKRRNIGWWLSINYFDRSWRTRRLTLINIRWNAATDTFLLRFFKQPRRFIVLRLHWFSRRLFLSCFLEHSLFLSVQSFLIWSNEIRLLVSLVKQGTVVFGLAHVIVSRLTEIRTHVRRRKKNKQTRFFDAGDRFVFFYSYGNMRASDVSTSFFQR